MKKLLTIFFLFAMVWQSMAQNPFNWVNAFQRNNNAPGLNYPGFKARQILVAPALSQLPNLPATWMGDSLRGAIQYLTADSGSGFYGFNGVGWTKFAGSSSTMLSGGPITSLPTIGFNPGTNISAADFIANTFYQGQPPTATLTGGQSLELMATGSALSYTLNWGAGRQSATQALTSIVVDGVSQTFTTPAAGASISGTKSVSVTRNVTNTFINTVTTADSKTATATTSFTFGPKRYYGWLSDTTGISSTSFNDALITALGNELSSSKSKSWSTGNPTGTQFYIYAYYATAGALTQFDVNGFPSILSMNTVSRDFTNALGFTGTWRIYWTKNGQTTASSLIAN